MKSKSTKILLTGLPGCGKTTAVMKITENLDPEKIAGFYTQEIRQGNTRKGFSWTRFDGTTGILAHTDIKGPHKVGKYGVDVAGFEAFLASIAFFDPEAELIIIDEIGKMECFSSQFKHRLKQILDSEKSVVATIALKGGGLIGEIKQRPDVKLFQMTRQNRNDLLPEILQSIPL